MAGGERADLRDEHLLGDGGTDLDGVRAIGDDLRLDDGHQTVLLADGGVLRQVLHAHVDGEVAGDALGRVDLQHVPPLGEARALRVRLGAALVEVVDALAPRLGVPERAIQRAREARLVVALVHLNARDHAVLLDHVNELLAVAVLLEERLPVEDNARDVLAQARRREAHGTVRRAVLGGVLDLLGLDVAGTQPRAGRLVSSKEALARRRHGVGGGLQLGHESG